MSESEVNPQDHTYQKNIDVPTDMAAILQVSFHPSQQQAEDGLLDVVMPMDTRGQWSSQLVKDILEEKEPTEWDAS